MSYICSNVRLHVKEANGCPINERGIPRKVDLHFLILGKVHAGNFSTQSHALIMKMMKPFL